MAVGTPADLENSIRGRRTIIQLGEMNDVILSALKKLQVKNLAIDGSKLIIDIENPKEDNPEIVSTIVAAGGKVQTVAVTGSTLEEAYLKLVRDMQ